MPAMKKTALSDCSYPESTVYNIRDDIDATITRLKVVIDEEASLRNALRALFAKRREEAIEQVRMANLHLHLVNQEEAAFCADVTRASMKIKEELGGSVTVGLLRANLVPQRPLSFELQPRPPVHVELGLKEDVRSRMSSPLHVNLSPRPDSMVDAAYDRSLRPPAISPPPRMPQQSPSIYSFAPPRSLVQSAYGNEPPRSPARSSRAFSPTRSPVQYTCGMYPTGSQHEKATETKATDAKKKKGKGKKANPKGTDTKPTPNVLSPTDEAPPNLDADKPKSPGVDEDEESAAEDPAVAFFAAALAKYQKGTALKTPAARRAEKKKKPNLLSMPTEDLTGEPFIANFDNDPQDLLKSPAKSNRGLPGGDPDQIRPPRTPARSTHRLDDTAPPKSPTRSTRGLFDDPPRSPARSTRAFDPAQSPARSTYAFAVEPTRPPARSTRGLVKDPTRSPVKSTRGLFNEPPRSPARSTHAFEPPRSPARSVRGLNDGPTPILPARSNRGLPSDEPPRSPARSARGLDDTYLSPDSAGHSHRTPGKTQTSLPEFWFGDNNGSDIEEPKKSPARPSAALPTTFAFSGGGFGTSPTANTGFGFGATPTVNTTCWFGASTKTDTGSQSPSASIGFGGASLGNTGFGFGGTSPTINFGLRPRHPTFDSNISSFGATTQTTAIVDDTPASMDDLFADMVQDADIEGRDTWGFGVGVDVDGELDAYFDECRGKSPKAVANNYLGEQLDSGYQHDDVGVFGSGANGQYEGLDGDFEMAGEEHVQKTPAREASPMPGPPEEPPIVVVAPKKKKKGKKTKEAPAADFLSPEQPTLNVDAEERAIMEEIKLREDKLEAELKQLEAEEAEQDRREEARLIAEAAENERIDRELLEEARRLAAEEESEYLHYLSLKEVAVVAEERLSAVQAELDALETQKLVILRQAESAREQEASCRYHKIMRSK